MSVVVKQILDGKKKKTICRHAHLPSILFPLCQCLVYFKKKMILDNYITRKEQISCGAFLNKPGVVTKKGSPLGTKWFLERGFFQKKKCGC